jgi:hypothetical protein
VDGVHEVVELLLQAITMRISVIVTSQIARS